MLTKSQSLNKTEQMLIFQRVNSLSRSSSKWKFHPSTNGQNRSIHETKAPTNIKEVRHFLSLLFGP